jgi:hypothetical protein
MAEPLRKTEDTSSKNSDQSLKIDFTESVLRTRWDFSKWIDTKMGTCITISGLFSVILGYFLISVRVNITGFSLVTACVALVLMIGGMVISVFGLAPKLRNPRIKIKNYGDTSLRNTMGIKSYTYEEYLIKIQSCSANKVIEENVNQIITLNEIILRQNKILKIAAIFIIVSGILAGLAIITAVL